MHKWQFLRDIEPGTIEGALKDSGLFLKAGEMIYRLRGTPRYVQPFLEDQYRDFHASACAQLAHFDLTIRPPRFWRHFIRPQLVPNSPTMLPVVPLPASMAPLTLEMGMNLFAALQVMRALILHAGVVEGSKGAIIMSAASGKGKSTLTAALEHQGYRLLSDEFGMVDHTTGQLLSFPRPISLKNQSISVVREMVGAGWVSQPLTGTPKGSIAYKRIKPEDIAAGTKRADPAMILLPAFEPGRKKPHVKAISPEEAYVRLMPSSTNFPSLGEAGFGTLLRLVETAPAYEIKYGSTEQSLEIVRDLEKDLPESAVRMEGRDDD